MNGAVGKRARRVRCVRAMLVFAVAAFPSMVIGADYPDTLEALPSSGPRYFPRGDGTESVDWLLSSRRRVVDCTPRRALLPTDAPDDPSYVGSTYGLGKPSYYGLRPPLGMDDPYGRPLRYCP